MDAEEVHLYRHLAGLWERLATSSDALDRENLIVAIRLKTQLIQHRMMAARMIVEEKFLASLSYRVATRRQSLRCENARSMMFRPL
jgi:hypothetical protein